MLVLGGVFHDLADVQSGVLQDNVVSSGVVIEELRDVIDFAVAGDPAARRGAVLSNVLSGVDANSLGHGGSGGCR